MPKPAADPIDVDAALDTVKAKAKELLDADGDGKLTAEDAKRLAISMTSKASSVRVRRRARLMRFDDVSSTRVEEKLRKGPPQ